MITRKKLPLGLILLLCISLLPISPSAANAIAPPETKIPNFDCYRDAASITARMQLLAKPDSSLSELKTIGTSVGRAPIYALEIGNEANVGKPHFILLAGLHGNDFSQPELGLQLAETLLEGYGTNADLRWIVDNIELDLILLANPDGRIQAEQQAEEQAPQPFADPPVVDYITNTNGFDLEENFCVAHPESQGCEPGDYQPETQAIRTYLNKKLGIPDPTQTPNEQIRDLFVYFSSHSKSTMLPIGNIRIPWFYKPNPSELSDLTDSALKRQNELAEMLKVLNKPSLSINGNIQPTINGLIKANYPVDFVFRSYGVSSLELSAFPTYDDRPVDCDRFANNHPENYLTALLKMAKSAASPYKIGYGPIVNELIKTSATETEFNYHAVIFEKNQIPDQPVPNPITSLRYYIDQPTGTISEELHNWVEIEDKPFGIEFWIPIESLTPGKYILTLKACSQDEFDVLNEVCGLPLSAYLIVPYPQHPTDPSPTDTPDDPAPTEPPDDPEPPGPGSNIIYLPLIAR